MNGVFMQDTNWVKLAMEQFFEDFQLRQKQLLKEFQ